MAASVADMLPWGDGNARSELAWLASGIHGRQTGANRNSTVLEYEDLLQAIRAGDTSRALAEYRKHLRNTRQQLSQSLNLSG